ncbi:MAG TPA: hypothetical protein PK624_14015 [Spirochaetota bacterium]|nr:hypothetical protein [Spirochaetota bacterium]HPK57552.1 hypothetical protein [Spirochaetota bacterium]
MKKKYPVLRGDKLRSCRLLDEIVVMKTAKNGFRTDFGVFLGRNDIQRNAERD